MDSMRSKWFSFQCMLVKKLIIFQSGGLNEVKVVFMLVKQAHNHAVLNRECNHRVFQLPFSLSNHHELDVLSFSIFSFKTFCPKVLNEQTIFKIYLINKY